MSDTPPELDLKFLPDWLKEAPAVNRYADYEGESGRRDDRRSSYGGDRRGQRPGAPAGDRRGGPRPGGPRPPGGGGPRPAGPGARPGGAPGNRPAGGQRPGARPGQGPRRDDRRDARPQDRRPPQDRPAPAPVQAQVRIEFLPEANGAGSIARQIKQSGRAYPLFGTGRLFLERPERHRVKITSLDPATPLHQMDDGAISFDRATLERTAFRTLRGEYYREEVVQGEPLKGNFTNVARTRTIGALLGPTNHHGYQPALRKLFEERYSRRMSFQEFVQREVEVVTDEQTINQWKENARSSTTFVTLKEEEPITFKSAAEAEDHFRKTYLPGLLKSGTTLECSGQASRAITDRGIANALRDAWEKERAFPAQLVNHLRPYLLEAGLHFFKHRKRVLYISAVKPVRHSTAHALTDNVAAIIKTIEASPRCTRRDLAAKILGENHDSPEMLEQKAALARDLHYLVHAGHVIEFHDGILDLPMVPGQPQQQGPQKAQTRPASAAPAAVASEATPENAEGFSEEEFLSAGAPEGAASSESSLTAETSQSAEVSQSFTADSDMQQGAQLSSQDESLPGLTESSAREDVAAGASTIVTSENPGADLSIEAFVAPTGVASEVATMDAPEAADPAAAQVADHLEAPSADIPVDAPVIVTPETEAPQQ